MRAERGGPGAGDEPRRSQLRRILDESPEARGRLGRAIASLGFTTLVAIMALCVLLIWHLRRRASLIRERLGAPKDVRLVDPLADRPEKSTSPNTEG